MSRIFVAVVAVLGNMPTYDPVIKKLLLNTAWRYANVVFCCAILPACLRLTLVYCATVNIRNKRNKKKKFSLNFII